MATNKLPGLQMHDSLNELFSTEQERQENAQERIVTVNCTEIDSFQNHPFKVRDNQDMQELVSSIRENGVMMPCIVRPKQNGRYEMISGHRRKHAALLAGINELPVIVRNLTDEQAVILMVDSNAHRPYLLPSEKAFAYKMRVDAMKRQAGRPTKDNLVPVGQNYSRMQLAEQTGESQTQIQRFIRLTNLIPEFLQMVDNSVEKPEGRDQMQIAMRPAVELSYLTPENQRLVLEFVESSYATPSHAQAIQLRQMQNDGNLSAQSVLELLRQEKPNQKEHISFAVDKFSRFFAPRTSKKDMEAGILKALEFYQKHRQERTIGKE